MNDQASIDVDLIIAEHGENAVSAKLDSSMTNIDREIPTLPRVLDSVELSKHLESILPWAWGALQGLQIQVLRHHRGKRCTVEIDILTTTGWRQLIGKIYADDRSDVYETMEALKQAGFCPEAEFSIPQPLAYLPTLHLLLYEKVQGLRADNVFLIGNEHERKKVAERCAQWLARFQAVAHHPGRTLSLTDHLIFLERWSRRIARGGEPLANKAKRLFEQLALAASAHDSSETCLSHGDFSTRNVIFVKDRTVVYDWDGCKLANPCRDVAGFMVDLSWLGLRELGSVHALNATAETFLKTYSANSQPEVMTHLQFYRAARCLKIAENIFRKEHPHWHENVEAILDEGICALEKCKSLSGF